jgi:hypothetical protein
VNPSNFLAELKRRNVYKVAVAYIVAGWALSQGIAQVLPVFDVPNWAIRLIVVLIIIGLPVALVLAWVFEITPEGIKRTEIADRMPAAARRKKHRGSTSLSLELLFRSRCSFLAATVRSAERLDTVKRLQEFQRNQSQCCRSIT